ncbi:unnamed protein product, partial [Bubo scandiacus]
LSPLALRLYGAAHRALPRTGAGMCHGAGGAWVSSHFAGSITPAQTLPVSCSHSSFAGCSCRPAKPLAVIATKPQELRQDLGFDFLVLHKERFWSSDS